jgi:hypothetical protein
LRTMNQRKKMRLFSFAVCAVTLLSLPTGVIPTEKATAFPADTNRAPRLVSERPTSQRPNTPGDPYWFQAGAIGDNSSYHFTGVNITIRTVYDKVSEGDHSYWVGALLSDSAFIQVGYLTTLDSNNRPYCCAWFYEFFPITSFYPTVLGAPGSAGPIGSWHTYSMLHTGNGFWTIYMDNQQLGPALDTGARDSGANAPTPTAEAAGVSTNQDILGPAEFKDLTVRLSDGWQPVHSAKTFIYYAEGTIVTQFTPKNPYGVWEVEGKNNDFLAGSRIPQPAPVQPNPGAVLWPIPSLNYGKINFSFVDREQQAFTPDWISLEDSGNWAFYTEYTNQLIPPSTPDNWTLDSLVMHTVDVTPQGVRFSTPETTSLTVQGNVFSVEVQVFGALYTLPVAGAVTETTFPDSTTLSGDTDSSGKVTLRQLVPGTYKIRIRVPAAPPSLQSFSIDGPGNVILTVLGLGEMTTIFLLPILGVAVVWRTASKPGAYRRAVHLR